MQILNVTITPDVVKEDQNIHVVAYYSLKEDVADGMVNINLNAAGIPLDLPLPLCAALDDIGMQCPLKKGIGKFDVTEFIPEAPTGTYNGSVTVNDKNRVEILCINLNFQMMP